jgi:hypothetical protein
VRSASALGIYGLLFLGSALLLYLREPNQHRIALSPETQVAGDVSDQTPVPVRTTRDDPARAESRQDLKQAKSTEQAVTGRDIAQAAVIEPVTSLPQYEKKLVLPKAHDNLGLLPRSSPTGVAIEDRIYVQITRTFSVIEKWFHKHGSPSQSGEHTGDR